MSKPQYYESCKLFENNSRLQSWIKAIVLKNTSCRTMCNFILKRVEIQGFMDKTNLFFCTLLFIPWAILYSHDIMSHNDQAVSSFLSAFEKKNYVAWFFKIDFECLGKEMLAKFLHILAFENEIHFKWFYNF